MGKFIDLTGKRFERLTVIEIAGRDAKNRIRWRCKCDCGNETLVQTGKLTSGGTKSCGCWSRDRIKSVNGVPCHRLTRVYYGMKERCYNPSNISYKYYGARGITICDEWMRDKIGREKFIAWALEQGYDINAKRGECTIDRINHNKGYSPDNCRVVNQCIQNMNKRFDGGKTGVCGVDYRSNRYIARISYNRKRISLGCFDTLEEAAEARKAAELKYYGQVLTD